MPTAPCPLPAPGLLLSFDDHGIAGWVEAIPLLAHWDARVTFFVHAFDQLSPEAVQGLHTLAEHGHAIGCHSLRHERASVYAETGELDRYLASEIHPALALMKEAGFAPTSFAYPNSASTPATDAALAPYFRHLRTGRHPQPGERLVTMDDLFVPVAAISQQLTLTGACMDIAPQRPLEPLLEAIQRAADQRCCLTLYGHQITPGQATGHHTPHDRLHAILATAHQAGLAFYSFDDLP